jgi:hypothetical protein
MVYRVLAIFVGLVYWWISYGFQFYVARDAWFLCPNCNSKQTGLVVNDKDKIRDMRGQLDSDAQLNEEFKQFAAKQYVTESLLFLEDTAAFKRMFFQKGDSWRFSKAKLLMRMYIVPGADLQVNISEAMRSAIIKQVESGAIKLDLFDQAVLEVEHIIKGGVWIRFVNKRQ